MALVVGILGVFAVATEEGLRRPTEQNSSLLTEQNSPLALHLQQVPNTAPTPIMGSTNTEPFSSDEEIAQQDETPQTEQQLPAPADMTPAPRSRGRSRPSAHQNNECRRVLARRVPHRTKGGALTPAGHRGPLP